MEPGYHLKVGKGNEYQFLGSQGPTPVQQPREQALAAEVLKQQKQAGEAARQAPRTHYVAHPMMPPTRSSLGARPPAAAPALYYAPVTPLPQSTPLNPNRVGLATKVKKPN